MLRDLQYQPFSKSGLLEAHRHLFSWQNVSPADKANLTASIASNT